MIIRMVDENDIHLLVSRDDRNRLPEKELLPVSKPEKIENHLRNSLFQEEQRISLLFILQFSNKYPFIYNLSFKM